MTRGMKKSREEDMLYCYEKIERIGIISKVFHRATFPMLQLGQLLLFQHSAKSLNALEEHLATSP